MVYRILSPPHYPKTTNKNKVFETPPLKKITMDWQLKMENQISKISELRA